VSRSRIEYLRKNLDVLRRLRTYLGENEKPLRGGLDVIRGAFKKEFDQEGSYGGSGWRPLEESTVEDRERRLEKFGGMYGPEHPILYRSGDLMRSWSDKRSPAHFQLIEKNRAEVGSSIETKKGGWNLAAIHNEGTTTGVIPARPIFGPQGELPEQDQERIKVIFDKGIDEMYQKAI
jgi:hypothetical protein